MLQACNREECLQKSGDCNSPPLTMKFKRWNTFWVVQPYSGTRSSIRINWICKPLLLVSKRKKEHPEFGHPKMGVPKPFQITKRQIIGICNNPWKMHMFYVLISWNWILICTVKLHGSHHHTMHKQGSKSHLHFEKKCTHTGHHRTRWLPFRHFQWISEFQRLTNTSCTWHNNSNDLKIPNFKTLKNSAKSNIRKKPQQMAYHQSVVS